MAYTSIQTPFGGGSGYDPAVSLIEGLVENGFNNMISGYVGNYFGGKSSKKQLKRAIQFASWQAQNLPSLQREGLEKAGFNPLLALGGHFGGNVGSSSFQTFQGMPSHPGSGGSSSVQIKNFEGETQKANAKTAKEEAEQSALTTEILRMEKDAQASETSARSAQAFVDEMEAEATSMALTGVMPYVEVDGKPTYKSSAMDNPKFRRMVEKLENQIERDKYINSKEHAIYEDGINAIHGINQGASAYESWRNGRRSYTPFYRHRRR